MKRFLLLTLLIVQSAYSLPMNFKSIGFTPNNDEIVEITNPKFGDAEFALYSWNCAKRGTCEPCGKERPCRHDFDRRLAVYLSEDGMCKALGFEKAVKHSSDTFSGSDESPKLQFDSKGRITGAAGGYPVSVIKCLNKVNSGPFPKITYYNFPRTADGLPISCAVDKNRYMFTFGNKKKHASSEDGICRYLGHKKSVYMSSLSQLGYRYFQASAVINADGQVKEVVEAIPSLYMICVD